MKKYASKLAEFCDAWRGKAIAVTTPETPEIRFMGMDCLYDVTEVLYFNVSIDRDYISSMHTALILIKYWIYTHRSEMGIWDKIHVGSCAEPVGGTASITFYVRRLHDS